MERIEKDYGYLIIDNGRIFDIEGGHSDQGIIYKDCKAFETGEGICYVSEYGLEDIYEQLTDLQARYENGEMTDDECRAEREKIILGVGETRQTIIQQIIDGYCEDYMLTYEQILLFAEDIFNFADWAYISTYLAENFDLEDCIEGDKKGVFNEFQHKAVELGMTPKEYAKKLGLV